MIIVTSKKNSLHSSRELHCGDFETATCAGPISPHEIGARYYALARKRKFLDASQLSCTDQTLANPTAKPNFLEDDWQS